MDWHPTRFERFEDRLSSSMGVCRLVTDAGKAHVKCLGNKTGPHGLASDLIGTNLAKAMGLPTFDFAIFTIEEDDLPFDANGKEEPGPAFATRTERGSSWDGNAKSLERLVNPDDLAKLIVLDTWVANWDRLSPSGDRHNFDNVFLSQEKCEPDEFRLIAMDFSHCIGKNGELRVDVSHIGRVKDIGIYSAFDSFMAYVNKDSVQNALNAMQNVTDQDIITILDTIPVEWQVPKEIKAATQSLLIDRREFMLEKFIENATAQIGPQLNLSENEV